MAGRLRTQGGEGRLSAESNAQRRARFETMFRTHYRAVDAFVGAQFPSADRADVMSLTFETAWRRFDAMPSHAERGWLIGVARNTALNSLRGRRRRITSANAVQDLRPRLNSGLHDHHLAPETIERLQTAFSKLTDADREVIHLAADVGLTGNDLGEALGVKVGTAAVRLHRARERFAAAYDEAGS